MGRNTIREAIKILEYLGVLEVKQGLGTFVRTKNDFSIVINSIHHSDLYEHVEVRCLLEIEIAKLAARYSTPEDMRDVIACLEHRAATNQQDVANFMLSDKKLHLAIAKATHNKALQATYEYFLNSSYQYTLELVTNKIYLTQTSKYIVNLFKLFNTSLSQKPCELRSLCWRPYYVR